jgi:uncharacterized OB-fold protein
MKDELGEKCTSCGTINAVDAHKCVSCGKDSRDFKSALIGVFVFASAVVGIYTAA